MQPHLINITVLSLCDHRVWSVCMSSFVQPALWSNVRPWLDPEITRQSFTLRSTATFVDSRHGKRRLRNEDRRPHRYHCNLTQVRAPPGCHDAMVPCPKLHASHCAARQEPSRTPPTAYSLTPARHCSILVLDLCGSPSCSASASSSLIISSTALSAEIHQPPTRPRGGQPRHSPV